MTNIYSLLLLLLLLIIIIIILLLLKPWIILDDRLFILWRMDGGGRRCERKAFCTFRIAWPPDHDPPLSGILFSNLWKNKTLAIINTCFHLNQWIPTFFYFHTPWQSISINCTLHISSATRHNVQLTSKTLTCILSYTVDVRAFFRHYSIFFV